MGAICGKILDHSQSILADSLVSRLVQQRLGYEAISTAATHLPGFTRTMTTLVLSLSLLISHEKGRLDYQGIPSKVQQIWASRNHPFRNPRPVIKKVHETSYLTSGVAYLHATVSPRRVRTLVYFCSSVKRRERTSSPDS